MNRFDIPDQTRQLIDAASRRHSYEGRAAHAEFEDQIDFVR